MIGDFGSFLAVSWKFPGTVHIWLLWACAWGAGVAGEVVALTCACGSRVCEPIVPEFLTCTTSALLVDRIGWMSHNAARVETPAANLGERAGKPGEQGRWR